MEHGDHDSSVQTTTVLMEHGDRDSVLMEHLCWGSILSRVQGTSHQVNLKSVYTSSTPLSKYER